jgi:hypothetical protein
MRIALGAVICSLAFVAAPAGVVRAEQFYGQGPAPVRNYQPIQLIFLNLPVERARTLAAGSLRLHIESVESNTISTVSNAQVEAILKLETNRTVFGAKAGLRPGMEIGIDVPFLSHFGGFLDPFIDGVEETFGTFNPERDLYPDNTFGAFFARRPTVTLFEGRRQDFRLGDIWLSMKHELCRPADTPVVALRLAAKLPTGRLREMTGSGKPDFALGFALEHQPLSWLLLYGNLAGVFPVGPITDADLTLNPMLNQSAAAEARIFRNVSLLLQQQTYTSPLHGNGTRILDGTVVELTLGASFRLGRGAFLLAATDNLSPVATAADFSLMLRVVYQP